MRSDTKRKAPSSWKGVFFNKSSLEEFTNHLPINASFRDIITFFKHESRIKYFSSEIGGVLGCPLGYQILLDPHQEVKKGDGDIFICHTFQRYFNPDTVLVQVLKEIYSIMSAVDNNANLQLGEKQVIGGVRISK